MPSAPARPCPRCPKLQPCPVHSFDSVRGTSTKRGYGGNWRKIRAAVLIEEPVCRECLIALELKRADVATAIKRVALLIDQTEAQVQRTFESMERRRVTKKSYPVSASSQVDHIVPKPVGPDDRANLQGLCLSCHSTKTAIESSRW